MNNLKPTKAWNLTRKDSKLLRQVVRDYVEDTFCYEGQMKACYVSRYMKYVAEYKQPHYGAIKDWFTVKHIENQEKSELERMQDVNHLRVKEIESLKEENLKLRKMLIEQIEHSKALHSTLKLAQLENKQTA